MGYLQIKTPLGHRLGLLLAVVSLLATGLAGCKNSSSGEVSDNSPRLVIADNSLAVSKVTTSGFTLNWEAATSGADPLTYSVYTSTGSKLETTEQIAKSGVLQAEVTTNQAVVTGLRRDTKYYINVLVQDQDGAKKIYSATKTTTNRTDITAPSSTSISISSGAATSNSATVSVTLSAIDDVAINGYYLSTNSTPPAVTDSGWVAVGRTSAYSAIVSHTFSDTSNGKKTLYAWFKDTAENVSSATSDSIGLFFNWSQEAYVKPGNTGVSDYFGVDVDISGDLLVVGASDEDANQTTITTSPNADDSLSSSGAAYVFLRSNGSWASEAYLKASNAEAADFYGSSVAIDNATVVVGAGGEASSQTTITNGTTASSDNSYGESGAAYVYVRNGTTWTQQAYLKAPNPGTSDTFGCALAISGDTIVVGAWAEDGSATSITNSSNVTSDNLANNSGAAYVFVRSGTTWSHQAYLKSPNGEANDRQGEAVAIDGDTILVAAAREAAGVTTITNGASVADDDSAAESGAVYVYVRSGTNWSHQAYLKAPNAEAYDSFGQSVAISGDTAVVGAMNEDSNQTTITNGVTASNNNSTTDSGAAYVFVRSGTGWAQEAFLKAPNPESYDYFGAAVTISEDMIAVSAPYEDSAQTSINNSTTASSDNSASGAGAVYVFVRHNNSWTHKAYLKAPNADADDLFGYAVALDANTLVVGANYEDGSQTNITNDTWAATNNNAANSGATYVFTAEP